MYRLFLAGRYTLARPVSYLAMVSIGLAIMALIVVYSIMSGFLSETERVIRGSTADIVVFPFQSRGPSPRAVMEARVLETPGVAGVSARLVRPALFKVHGASNPIMWNSMETRRTLVKVLGVEAGPELEHTRLGQYLEDVRDPRLTVGDTEDPFFCPPEAIRDARLRFTDRFVLMGEDVMRGFGLQRGDAIDLVTVPDGAVDYQESITPSLMTFVIAGAFRSGHANDDSAVFVELPVAREWAGTDHEFSELYVTAVDTELEALEGLRDRLRGDLRDAFEDCIVQTWRDRNSTWMNAVENERRILLLILLFFLLLVCTISFSVLTMLVQQKVRDIGILSAMGASAGGVGSVFATVGVVIATLGGLFGLGTGVLLAENINAIEQWLERQFGWQVFDRNVYAFSEIPVETDMTMNLVFAVVTAAGAVLICLVPAWFAARMDPVEALRHE